MITWLLAINHRIWLAGGIFLAGAAGGWVVQGWRMGAELGPLKAEVSRLQSRSTILESANVQCSKSVEAANEATGRLLAQAKAREQRAQEAVKAARTEAAGLATSIAALRALPKPTGAPDELCTQARGILADEVGSRAR